MRSGIAPSRRQQLDALQHDAGQDGEAVLDPGVSYRPGLPIHIHARKRGNRYDLTDGAAAVDLAGRPDRWFDVASGAVAPMNINRRGVVFVTGFEGRDIADLALRLAESSRRVYLSLLEADD